MRRFFSLILISLMLVGSVTPALGSGYRESALVFLMEKYGVAEEKVELSEGGITELEFTAESFWFAKYTIAQDGKAAQGVSGGTEPMLMPLPAPDMPADADAGSTRSNILPSPPRDIMGELYGGVYIRLKTGEILELDQMNIYFEAERRLGQQEWERLRQEAGKLDISLYQKLQGLSVTEIVSVWIKPIPVETEDLKAYFAALKSKYPEQSRGMTLNGILSDTYGYSFPDPGNGSVSERSVEKTESLQYMDMPVTDDILSDEEHRKEFGAFWEEIEQIRILATTPSLVKIRAYLEGMGIPYSDNVTSISADLSVAQIHEIAKMSAVAAVFEEFLHTTMEDTMMLRGSADGEKMTALAEASDIENKRSYLPVILLATTMLPLLMWRYYPEFKRVIRNNKQQH